MVKWLKNSKQGNVKYDLKCWRRLALIVGAAASGVPFRLITDIMEKGMIRYRFSAFKGLRKASKPCSIDNIFLKNGELTHPSKDLLLYSNEVYETYAEKWMDVVKELEELRSRWVNKRYFSPEEAFYALGLAILLAKAKALGKNVDVKAAETALWLSGFSIQSIAIPFAIDDAIVSLYPLRDLHKSGWINLIINASQVGVTNQINMELDNIYNHIQNVEEWIKAKLAMAYADMGDVSKACFLLNEIKDNALRIITKTYVYSRLTELGLICPYIDICKELKNLNQDLNYLESQYILLKIFLEMHPEFRKFLEWCSVRENETKFIKIILEARSFILFDLGYCALHGGEFENAENYFRMFSSQLKGLEGLGGDMTVEINTGWWITRIMVLKGERLENVIKEFERLWRKASNMIMRPYATYVITKSHILGDYLIALSLIGRREEVEKLFIKYGSLLNSDKRLFAAIRLTLEYLGLKVGVPSKKEVLEAIKEYILLSELLPALTENLDRLAIDVTAECADTTNSELCIDAYMAIKGNKAAEEKIRQSIISALSWFNVPYDLLKKADIKQLIEVSIPGTSLVRFILLLWDLISNDRDTALLHAEVMKAMYRQMLLGKLFGELADALKNGDEDKVKSAIVKLYYFHF